MSNADIAFLVELSCCWIMLHFPSFLLHMVALTDRAAFVALGSSKEAGMGRLWVGASPLGARTEAQQAPARQAPSKDLLGTTERDTRAQCRDTCSLSL